MFLLLILCGALADAGYHYGVPSVPFHLPSEQTSNFQTAQTSADFNNGHSQSSISNTDFNVNIDVAVPFTDNFHHGHAQTISPDGVPISTPYSQRLTFPVNLNHQYTSSSSAGINVNSYEANAASSSGTNSYNDGHAFTTNNLNLNNGISQTAGYSENAYNALPQTLLPPLESNLNGDFAQSTNQNSNNLNINSIITNGAGNLNDQFVQRYRAGAITSKDTVSSGTPAPTIFKHVYFHVPSPDIEEQAVTPLLQPQKKIYKILLIKLPSQEMSNTARLNQLVRFQNAGVEEKTLVFVLVKKPDRQQNDEMPQRTKSNHEVFFVKYNGESSKINDELKKSSSVESIGPVLHPGLVNGYK